MSRPKCFFNSIDNINEGEFIYTSHGFYFIVEIAVTIIVRFMLKLVETVNVFRIIIITNYQNNF